MGGIPTAFSPVVGQAALSAVSAAAAITGQSAGGYGIARAASAELTAASKAGNPRPRKGWATGPLPSPPLRGPSPTSHSLSVPFVRACCASRRIAPSRRRLAVTCAQRPFPKVTVDSSRSPNCSFC